MVMRWSHLICAMRALRAVGRRAHMRIGPAHVEAEAHDRIQRASIRGGGSDHIANDTNNTRHNASKVQVENSRMAKD